MKPDYHNHSSNSVDLSVIVITKNEEHNILECLSSVKWANDIVVVDAKSTDSTVKLAQSITDKVYIVDWNGYAEAKQYALSKTKYDWVLWLDADERVTKELAEDIRLLDLETKTISGFEIARRAFFIGKWIRHCGWYPGYVTRLFRKDKANFIKKRVHESLEITDGKIERLKNDILHYTDTNLFHYFAKLNIYTSNAAQDLYDAGKIFSWYDVLIRPPYMFIKMYFFRLGFLDGIHGLILCLFSSAYVFTKYMKLWDLKRINFFKQS